MVKNTKYNAPKLNSRNAEIYTYKIQKNVMCQKIFNFLFIFKISLNESFNLNNFNNIK